MKYIIGNAQKYDPGIALLQIILVGTVGVEEAAFTLVEPDILSLDILAEIALQNIRNLKIIMSMALGLVDSGERVPKGGSMIRGEGKCIQQSVLYLPANEEDFRQVLLGKAFDLCVFIIIFRMHKPVSHLVFPGWAFAVTVYII